MTEDDKRSAVIRCDTACDGMFYYAVKSTGIYCRPSCKSKQPKLENMLLFDTREDAKAAGFRPCKRCRPDLLNYQPAQSLALAMKGIIDSGYYDKKDVFEKLGKLGLAPKRAAQIFKEQFGSSPSAYADRLRLREAVRQLKETEIPVLEIAYALGFESLSAFYTFFGKHNGISPGEFRKKQGVPSAPAASFIYETAMGKVWITADHQAIIGIRMFESSSSFQLARNHLTDMAADQLEEYLQGKRKEFTVPLKVEGSDFQKRVWAALEDIPYGHTCSYKQVAQMIGNPAASRAVGMANNKNPILIMIPCHRVVGSNGALIGYAAGLQLKQKLLEIEKQHAREDESA